MLQKLRSNKKGFTLTDPIIVISVIGILAAIAIPNSIAYREKTFSGEAEHDVRSTPAAVSPGYAEPDHTDISLYADLETLEDLSLDYFGKNSGNATHGGSVTVNMTVTVTDDSARCPRDAVFSAPRGGAVGYGMN